MSSSPVQLAKRALVTLLLTLSRQYSLPALPINRDALDEAINEAFEKVSRKVHPDRGGAEQDAFVFLVALCMGRHP